ncbi:MAG: hypothetical protein ABI726_02180 [bacterium]
MDDSRRRCRTRVRESGELRPTDVIGAFFVLGIGFLVAAVVVAIANALEPWQWGRWLALHLAFVGGVSQLVLGASQFFAGAFLATDPPPRSLIRGELVAWNAGSILLAVAVPLSSDRMVEVAVALLLVTLALYAVGLVRMHRASLQSAPWATRWYAAGAGLFAVGIVAGAMLARALAWVHGDLLGAHMALNLAGWFGTAILGTLHTFYPSLARTTLRFPRLEPRTFGAWVVGVVALATGYGWAVGPLAIAGWIALSIAAVMLLANVAGCVLTGPRPMSLAARIVGMAQVFLLAGLLLATTAALADGFTQALAGSTRAAVGILLVAGWIGLTVLGSLVHLLAVVVRVRDLSRPMPPPRPRREVSTAALAAAGIVGLVFAQQPGLADLRVPALAALIGAYALLGSRVLALAARVVTHARPSI